MSKDQKKYTILVFIIGLVFIAIGILTEDKAGSVGGFYSGFGTGLLAVAIVKLIRHRRLAKNPEKLADYEAAQKDERTLYISNKARAVTFFITVYAELAAGLAALWFLPDPLVGKVLCFAASAQCFIFVLVYWYYNKKY